MKEDYIRASSILYIEMASRTRVRKILMEKISLLSDTEHYEIFKLLRESGIPFTQNRNGIFLNFKNVPDNIIASIDQFVSFCFANKKDLDEYDKRLNECKLNNNVESLVTKDKEYTLNSSMSLGDVLQEEQQSQDMKWLESMKDTKDKQRIENMIGLLESNLQKVHKKKSCNMKYANAKKKYGRRVIAVDSKKTECDVFSNLTLEDYPMLHPCKQCIASA